jgi:RNA polymerase sigma-70 factor (ECF subfamily)
MNMPSPEAAATKFGDSETSVMLSNVSSPATNDEAVTLAAALRGDEAAFQNLVEPFRIGLYAHCYRMLGCIQDAEDALQEALLRAWLRLSQFEGRSSFRTWLYTIATRTALDVSARRPKRLLPLDYLASANAVDVKSASSEVAYLEPFPADQLGLGVGLESPEARYELRESVELAFVAAVQHLAPRQRAILLLRDVLGFSAREAADTLGTTVAAANSALERARAAVTQRCPDRSQQVTLRAVGDAHVHDLVTRYMDVLERADLDGMLALLVEDASWSMPPEAMAYRGHAEVTAFLLETPFQLRWGHIPTSANGQPAVGCYIWSDERQQYELEVIDVLTLRGTQISAVTAFFDKGQFPSFGLPMDYREAT